MAKKIKPEKTVVVPFQAGKVVPFKIEVKSIYPITHEFGNGDMNIIRDKINEIIKLLS